MIVLGLQFVPERRQAFVGVAGVEEDNRRVYLVDLSEGNNFLEILGCLEQNELLLLPPLKGHRLNLILNIVVLHPSSNLLKYHNKYLVQLSHLNLISHNRLQDLSSSHQPKLIHSNRLLILQRVVVTLRLDLQPIEELSLQLRDDHLPIGGVQLQKRLYYV